MSEASSAAVHYLPCSISWNGPGPISSYFRTAEHDTKQDVKVAAFRGRELLVKRMSSRLLTYHYN